MTLRDDIIDYIRWHGPTLPTDLYREFNPDCDKTRIRTIGCYLHNLYHDGVLDRKLVFVGNKGAFNKSYYYAYFIEDMEDDRDE